MNVWQSVSPASSRRSMSSMYSPTSSSYAAYPVTSAPTTDLSSASLQHDQAARLARIQTACTGGVHTGLRRVAGCATSTGLAGHAGATASLKLTFEVGHSVGANHRQGRCLPLVGGNSVVLLCSLIGSLL